MDKEKRVFRYLLLLGLLVAALVYGGTDSNSANAQDVDEVSIAPESRDAKPTVTDPALVIMPDELEGSTTKNGMRVSHLTGVPLTMYGFNYPVAKDTPESMAREYLAANIQTFQLQQADLSDLVHYFTFESSAGHTVRFHQYIDGVQVYKSDIAVHISPNNAVTFVTNNYKSLATINSVKPALTADEARSLAHNYLGIANNKAVNLNIDETELVIYNNRFDTRLAYKVNTMTDQTILLGDWELLVDAQTGEIFRSVDRAVYEKEMPKTNRSPEAAGLPNGVGNVWAPDPLAPNRATYGGGYVDNNDADSAQLTGANQSVTLLDLTFTAGQYYLDGPYAEINDAEAPFNGLYNQPSSTFNYNRNADNFEAVNVYYHIDLSMRYLNETVGVAVMPYQYAGGVRSDPHGLSGADNSHYTSAGQIAWGEGCVDDAEDSDVIWHELGHGLHDWVTNGGLSQVDGLSEGSGDYWAASYNRYLDVLNNPNYWTSSDPAWAYTFRWDGHNPCWGGRSVDYRPGSPPYPGGLTGSIHTDGQIWATCMMDVWDEMTVINGNPGGRIKTDRIFWEGLAMTGGGSSQDDAANAVYNAAIANGYSTAELTAINSALSACGYSLPGLPGPADPVVCNGTTVSFEAGVPSDWTITSAGPASWAWTSTTSCDQGGITGESACSSPPGGNGQTGWGRVETPVIDMSAAATASLDLTYLVDVRNGSTFDIEVFDGATWTQEFQRATDQLGATPLSLNLDAYAGNANVQIAFLHTSNGGPRGQHAVFDEVSLTCAGAPATPIAAVNPASLSNTQATNTVVPSSFDVENSGAGDLNWTLFEDVSGFQTETASLDPVHLKKLFTGLQVTDNQGVQVDWDNFTQFLIENPGTRCATPEVEPKISDSIETMAQSYLLMNQVPSCGSITIPTYFHVVYDTGCGAANCGNIPQAWVNDQIDVLNAAMGPDYNFNLILTTRTENTTWYNTADCDGSLPYGCDNAAADAMKAALAIDADKHALNLYSTLGVGGTLGWATFPWDFSKAPAHNSGVVLNAQSMPGGSATPYNLGDTATHEVGHWLGLRHIWGDGACNTDDFVADTALAAAANFGCPAGTNSCAGGGNDMIDNFMDYTEDSCMDNFTNGQIQRMCTLTHIFRNELLINAPVVCGDGDLGGTETCDDGNTTSGDGCSNSCQLESGTDSCVQYTATDTPITINNDGNVTYESTINVPATGTDTIVDINILNFQGTHTWIADLNTYMRGPDGMERGGALFVEETKCNSGSPANKQDWDINFDDAGGAAGSWQCGPLGRAGTFAPYTPLSVYNGLNAAGTWTMSIDDTFAADGGSFDNWTLEVCTRVPGGAQPDIDVNPTSQAASQLPNVTTPDSFNIDNLGSADLNWSSVVEDPDGCGVGAPPSDISWLTGVGPTSGTTPAAGNDTVNYNWDSTGMSPGVYTGYLCITSDDPDEPVYEVDFTLTVQSPPEPDIDVNPASLAQNQFPDVVTPDTFDIDNVGGATLNWSSIVEDPDGCGVGAPASDVAWVTGVTPTSGTTPAAGNDTISFNWDSTGMAPGPYTSYLCIASDDPDEPVFQVTLNLTVQAPVACDSVDDISWITGMTPASGTTIPAGATTVNFNYDSTGLADGVYTASICLSSDDPTNPMIIVPVTLTVDSGCAAPGDVLDLGIAPNGTFVDLSWTGSGANQYEVHQATMPYTAPVGNGPTVVSEPATGPFTDNTVANTYGDPATNYFYYLLPENICGAWANPSNHVGEFDFSIIPGA